MQKLHKVMEKAAEDLGFIKAANYREKLKLLEKKKETTEA